MHDFGSCRNLESGAVFILASGLSATSFPLERFAHVPMITMNGAISIFLNTGVKPFFYVCSDRSFSEQQPHLFDCAMAISQRVALREHHARTCGRCPSGQLYGLSKVFLVGVDLHENSGRFYENHESKNSPCGLDQHDHTRILPSLELMAQKIIGDDFRVYNLSDCSRIPASVIPRVTLAQAQALI
ncbi:hypothetical protein [Pseudomonas sp. MPB23]|uniref:hypothetical protein n=1 Tax=Pseudomonas sp. MPB23 TaxID=3388490 RepID=UPI003984A770